MGREVKLYHVPFPEAMPARQRHGIVTHRRKLRKSNGTQQQQEPPRHPISSSQRSINSFSGRHYLVTSSGSHTPIFKEELARPGITDDGGKITDCGKSRLLDILRDQDQPPIKKAQTAIFLAKFENLKSKEFVQALVQALHQVGGNLLQRPSVQSSQTVHTPNPYTTEVCTSFATSTQPMATSPSEAFMFALAALYHVDKNSALEIIHNANLQEKDVQRYLKGRETKRLFE